MEQNTWFFRLFFLCFSCLAAIAYQHSFADTGASLLASVFTGSLIGFSIFAILFLAELRLRKYSLRTLNTALVGLLAGSLIGAVATFSLKALFGVISPSYELENNVLLLFFFASIYLGVMLTSASAESWWLNIPFVRLIPTGSTKTRKIIVDMQALDDVRLMELARTGLLDNLLIVPTFIVKEIQKSMESTDELVRTRGRRCHEHLKRLESLPQLDLEIKEFHLHDQEDTAIKLNRAARLTQAYILTSQEAFSLRSEEETATIINLETISIALKPGAQRGEALNIKIQRLGKEPKQGVGYLEDGTMVVVNGGGEHLGQTIRTQVLSQKYSSSGKIIFCNAVGSEEKKSLLSENGQYCPQLTSV